jgi:DNA (cytosine-5)-methyltransferase 1
MNLFKGYSVIDLFCGVGGLTHGFVIEKFNVIAGLDFDLSCKFSYEKNNKTKFIHSDLTAMHSNDIDKLYPNKNKRILVGCAPCQAFSPYSKNKYSNDKWKLLYSFSRIIRDIEPDIISMENVPNLLNYNGGKVFNDFVKVLEERSYYISYSIVNAQEYGVPQRRNRLILFASKLGDISIIKPTHKNKFINLRDAIGHLAPIEDGKLYENDLLHRSRKLSDLNKKRIIATPEGGGWKNWDEKLVLECHKKESGKSYGSIYGRMKWSDVSPTLTTQCTGLGNGRFGHPEQDRAISLREAALIQSFPEYYDFIDPSIPMSTKSIERQIGNAVPVRLGQIIAKSIKKHIAYHNG